MCVKVDEQWCWILRTVLLCGGRGVLQGALRAKALGLTKDVLM